MSSQDPSLFTSHLVQNQLLAALRPQEQNLLLINLERVALHSRDIIFRPQETIEFCYFVLSGVVSMTALMEDGDMTEVGIIGDDGFVGSPAILGNVVAEHQAIVQVAGEAVRVGAGPLRALCDKNQRINALLLRYVGAQMGMLSQAAACNVLHSAEQRFTRWLLMINDRVEGGEIALTHEFLAVMIGSRRATVTDIADTLQSDGIIALKRGRVTILDRKRLEKRTCECYPKMRDALARAHVFNGQRQ